MKFSPTEFLRHVATLKEADRERRHGGKRERCPNCGAEGRITLELCAHCGEVLHRSQSPVRHLDVRDGYLQPGLGEQVPDVEGSIAAEQERVRSAVGSPVRHLDALITNTPVRQDDAQGPNLTAEAEELP